MLSYKTLQDKARKRFFDQFRVLHYLLPQDDQLKFAKYREYRINALLLYDY